MIGINRPSTPKEVLANAAGICRDGAIAYVCMNWRHVGELFEVGTIAFDAFKNLYVWNKSNGGMGAFYRSKHELVFVFKRGSAKHVSNFGRAMEDVTEQMFGTISVLRPARFSSGYLCFAAPRRRYRTSTTKAAERDSYGSPGCSAHSG